MRPALALTILWMVIAFALCVWGFYGVSGDAPHLAALAFGCTSIGYETGAQITAWRARQAMRMVNEELRRIEIALNRGAERAVGGPDVG